MEEALRARLIATPSIAAIVGDCVDWFDRARVNDERPDVLVDDAICLTMIDPGREWTHDGPDGLDEPRVRVELFAAGKARLMALKRAVLAEMEQSRDVVGWRFHEATLDYERGDKPDDGPGETFRVTMDFSFYHEPLETAP